LKKVEDIFIKQKNTTLKIFLGRDDFEEIVFFFYLDATQDIFVFLGEQIPSLSDNITFSYHQDNILFDSIIL